MYIHRDCSSDGDWRNLNMWNCPTLICWLRCNDCFLYTSMLAFYKFDCFLFPFVVPLMSSVWCIIYWCCIHVNRAVTFCHIASWLCIAVWLNQSEATILWINTNDCAFTWIPALNNVLIIVRFFAWIFNHLQELIQWDSKLKSILMAEKLQDVI